MTRFIVVSFVFLGFAFYELSGGGDFDPKETRLSRIETPPAVDTQPIQTAAVEPAPVDAPVPENVTRIKLELSSVDDVLRPSQATRGSQDVQLASLDQTDPAAGIDDDILIPSLIVDKPVIEPVDFGAEPAVAVTGSTKQIRQVSGNSVNVRGGPGTDYSVVNRLVRGDEVEILQDPGDGWVKLRPVGGGPVGWMASFLLTQG